MRGLGEPPGKRRANHPILDRPMTQEQEEDSVWRVTALHFAVAAGHEALTRMLIAKGAQVRPYTRLLADAAVRASRPELLPILLGGGAEPQLAKEWAKRRPACGD